MKTWISLALVLMMLLSLSPAMATGDAADDSPSAPEEEYAGPARLAINPDSAYGWGYIPQAYKSGENWYVNIPLALRWEGSGFSTEKFKDVVVTVQPMLGSDSPLVPVTEIHEVMLDSTLGLNPQYFNSLGTSFDWMQLTDTCLDGNYSIDFLCSYELDGAFVEQTFTIEFMVSGKLQPEAEPQPEGPKSMPRLMLTAYTISPEKVYAGGDMTLNLTITNVSSKRDARNIKITVDSAGVFLPAGGTNVAFLSELEAEEEANLTFTFTVPKSVPAGPAPVTVSIAYEDREVNSASEVAEISVPVYQPIRLKIDEPRPTYTGMVGESFSVEMKLYNLGQSPLYNVMAEISGENIQPEGSYFGGTLEAGATKTVELSAIALDPGMNMGMEEPYMGEDVYGGAEIYEEDILVDDGVYYDESAAIGSEQVEFAPLMAVMNDGMYYGDGMMGGGSVVYDVTITLSYEDVTGDSYTEILTCQVEAMQMAYFDEPMYEDPYLPEEPMEEPRSLTWLWITLGCVGVLGVAALVVALSIRARKRKKEIDNALL